MESYGIKLIKIENGRIRTYEEDGFKTIEEAKEVLNQFDLVHENSVTIHKTQNGTVMLIEEVIYQIGYKEKLKKILKKVGIQREDNDNEW